MYCIVFTYVFSMLGLGRILISDLAVVDLFMHSLSGMIILYLAVSFFTSEVFLHEITITVLLVRIISLYVVMWM